MNNEVTCRNHHSRCKRKLCPHVFKHTGEVRDNRDHNYDYHDDHYDKYYDRIKLRALDHTG